MTSIHSSTLTIIYSQVYEDKSVNNLKSIRFYDVCVAIFWFLSGIDNEFERLLEDIFSAEFVKSFKLKRPAGWVDLMIAFESRKRAADPNKDQPLNVSLPFSFIDFYKKQFVSW